MASQGEYASRNGAVSAKREFSQPIPRNRGIIASFSEGGSAMARRRKRRELFMDRVLHCVAYYRVSRKIAFFCAAMGKSAGFTQSR